MGLYILEDPVVPANNNCHHSILLGRYRFHHRILRSPVDRFIVLNKLITMTEESSVIIILSAHHKTSVGSLSVDECFGTSGSGHAQRKLTLRVGRRRRAIKTDLAHLTDGLVTCRHKLFAHFVSSLRCWNEHQLLQITLFQIDKHKRKND